MKKGIAKRMTLFPIKDEEPEETIYLLVDIDSGISLSSDRVRVLEKNRATAHPLDRIAKAKLEGKEV